MNFLGKRSCTGPSFGRKVRTPSLFLLGNFDKKSSEDGFFFVVRPMWANSNWGILCFKCFKCGKLRAEVRFCGGIRKGKFLFWRNYGWFARKLCCAVWLKNVFSKKTAYRIRFIDCP